MTEINRYYEWSQVRRALAAKNWDFKTLARVLAARMGRDEYSVGYLYNIVSGLTAGLKTVRALEDILDLPRGTLGPRQPARGKSTTPELENPTAGAHI